MPLANPADPSAKVGEEGSPKGSLALLPSTSTSGASRNALRSLEGAVALLREASVEEAKEILDQAEAVRVYATRARLGLETQNLGAEIRMRAERRLGDLLSSMERRRAGEYPRGEQSLRDATIAPSLNELGVTKSQSSRWQRLARIPSAQFETHVEGVKEKHRELTSTGLLKLADALERDDTGEASAARVSDGLVASSLFELAAAKTKFGCIYADPPWPYDNQCTRAATSNHYDVMSLEDIASLPVRDLSLPDAHLHLWTTNAFLFDAKEIMNAWGFEYKSVLVWVKPHYGLGNYWRCAHEYLLLGVRGSATFRSRSHRSWLEAPRQRHSEKPEVIRSILETVSPGPYLELFARRLVAGWTVWGNQIGSLDTTPGESQACPNYSQPVKT